VTEYLGRWLLAGGHEVIYVEFPWAHAELCALGVAKCLRALHEERPDVTLYIGHPGSLGMMPPWPGPLAGLLTVEGPLMGELREHMPALDAVAAPSPFAAGHLLPHVRPSVGAVSVIPHGVDLEIYFPSVAGRRPGPMRFLSVAANTPRKGLGNLILAFGKWRAGPGLDARHRAWHAQLILATNIIGIGGHLGEACRAAGLDFVVTEDAEGSTAAVTFVGGWEPSGARLANLYRDADVYITSTTAEGFCMPILEAMASGLPVVAPLHTALADFPPDTFGWWQPTQESWIGEYSQAFAALGVADAHDLFLAAECHGAVVEHLRAARRAAALEYAERNTWDRNWTGDQDAGRIGILGLFAEAIANYQQRRIRW
jgi:glycosyltransferase involved in cell wall biosynthesis